MIDKLFDFMFNIIPNWLIYTIISALMSALVYFYIDTLTKVWL